MILRHHGLHSPLQAFALLGLTRLALGQDPTATTDNPTPTTMQTTTSPVPTKHQPSVPFPFSSSMLPSDSAPAGNHNNGMNAGGLVNYYFVFIALIVAVAGAVVFFVLRKRRRIKLRRRYSQNVALSRDLGRPRQGGGWTNWNPERTRGRYWQGRWRSAEASREEGLNEQGEAPPPYVPKRQSQEAERQEGEHEPAVPLQTLSRNNAGLKPPDYSEDYAQEQELGQSSSASASSSHEQGRRTNP